VTSLLPGLPVRKPGWFKGSKWWRRYTPQFPISEERKVAKARECDIAYLLWLAGERGCSIADARAHCDDQRRRLREIAERAVAGVKLRLRECGLRAVVVGGEDPQATSLAEYDARDRERRLGSDTRKLGWIDNDRWAFPGTAGTVHVGTRPAHHRHRHEKPVYSIVIVPGMAPSDEELDTMVEEAVAALVPRPDAGDPLFADALSEMSL
jgi:hypothetical protein